MTIFDFTIIYCKRAKNLIDSLFRRSNFKDDNELFVTKRQPLLNFLSKFQEHLEGAKNNPTKEQSIDSDETPLFKNVLSLTKIPQDTNSTRVLLTKSESRDKYSDSILDSIGYNQMKIPYLGLTSIIKKNNNQTKRVQFTLIVRIIDHKLYIL